MPRQRRRCRADAATAALPSHQPPCCHHHRHANAAVVAALPPQLPPLLLPPLPLFLSSSSSLPLPLPQNRMGTSAGANNTSSPPIIRAMPLLLLLGAILTLSLASLESGRRSARGEGPRPQTRCCGGLLLPPLEREVDDGNYDEVAAGGNPAAIGMGQRRRRSIQHRLYFLMLERAPAYFWVEFFVQESKHFMVEQNLILFYPWCYYATQKYHDMRRGICRTYVRYGTKMYGSRNYYQPPLDEDAGKG